MAELLAMVGVFFAIEGALYAGAPGFVRRMAARVQQMGDGELRGAGLAALAIGVGIVWLARG